MAGSPAPVQLVPIPRADADFEAWLAHLVETAGDLRAMTPACFEELVRARYPTAIVRPQEPLATLDPFTSVWYVYRDGSALDGRDEGGQSP